MKAYRYNAKNRDDRGYNDTGREKNPNQIKFYANSLEFAENYKYIYSKHGEMIYECELEVVELGDVKLFDMNTNAKSLNVFKAFAQSEKESRNKHYTDCLNKATKVKDKKMFQRFIDELENIEEELFKTLYHQEFQTLSDFEIQADLISEIKSLGFEGYFTRKEIAIF